MSKELLARMDVNELLNVFCCFTMASLAFRLLTRVGFISVSGDTGHHGTFCTCSSASRAPRVKKTPRSLLSVRGSLVEYELPVETVKLE